MDKVREYWIQWLFAVVLVLLCATLARAEWKSGAAWDAGGNSDYDATSVAITGGTINGVAQGDITPGAGTFTSLTATGNILSEGTLPFIRFQDTDDTKGDAHLFAVFEVLDQNGDQVMWWGDGSQSMSDFIFVNNYGGIKFYTDSAGSGALAATIDSDRDVCIGGSSPDAKLNVVNIAATSAGAYTLTTSGSSTSVVLPESYYSKVGPGTLLVANGETRTVTACPGSPTATVSAAVDWENGGAGYTFTYQPAAVLVEDSSGNVDMVVRGDGNVGFGVASPSDVLEISAGDIRLDDLQKVRWWNGTKTGLQAYIKSYAAYNTGAMFLSVSPTVGTSSLRICGGDTDFAVISTDIVSSGFYGAGRLVVFGTDGYSLSGAGARNPVRVGNGNFIATSGEQISVSLGLPSDYGGTYFAPTSGDASFVGVNIAPKINQTGTASGDYTILRINPTETSSLGSNGRLLDVQKDGISKFAVRSDGITAISGGMTYTITATAKAADYSATANDYIVQVDPTGGAVDIGIAAAQCVAGRTIGIKNASASANNITFTPETGNVEGSAAPYTLAAARGFRMFIFDGTEWHIIGAVN